MVKICKCLGVWKVMCKSVGVKKSRVMGKYGGGGGGGGGEGIEVDNIDSGVPRTPSPSRL